MPVGLAGALMMSNIMMRADSSGDNEIVLGDMSEGFAFGRSAV